MWHGLAVVGALLAAQIIRGAFVGGLKAGFLLNTFPLMAGRFVPPGLLAMSPAPIDFVQNLVTVQWMHRLAGTALLTAAVSSLGTRSPDSGRLRVVPGR